MTPTLDEHIQPFIPSNFIVPEKASHPNFVLLPLAPEHNEMDFDAWSTSIPELKGIFGPGNSWPEDVASLADNLRDLEKHIAGFHARTEATYTVLTPGEKRCLGCVYFRRSTAAGYDCRVDYWVRTSDRAEIEPLLDAFLKEWLKLEWPFRTPAFTGRDVSWADWKLACNTH